MIERGSRLRFTLESFQRASVVCHLLGQELQRDKTSKLGVLGLVHYAHSPAAEFLDDAVMRYGLSDKRLGLRHLAVILSREPKECQRLLGRSAANGITDSHCGDWLAEYRSVSVSQWLARPRDRSEPH